MLKTLFEACLDILFPKSAAVAALERMSAAEFVLHAGVAEEIEAAGGGAADTGTADTFALFSYKAEYTREAIHQLKYAKNIRVAALLGELLAQKLAKITARDNAGAEWILIPAPIHRKKRHKRGYNQIEFLLEHLPQKLPGNWRIERNILAKILHTTAQSELEGRAERLSNISSGCFYVTDPLFISGRNLILIDDVYTTGTTVNAMRSALLLAGAKRVVCVALAH